MNGLMTRSIFIFALVIAQLLIFPSVAWAEQAVPKLIYYENENNEIVKVDYQKALDDAFDEDTTMLKALRTKIAGAIGSFRAVFVEDQHGNWIDYEKAIQDDMRYPDAASDLLKYGVNDPPEPVKELIPDPDTGEAVERFLVKVTSVEDITGITVEIGTSEEEVISKLQSEVTASLDDEDNTAVKLDLEWEADEDYDEDDAGHYDFLYTLSAREGEDKNFKIPVELKTGLVVVVLEADDYKIEFEDTNLEEAIRDKIGKPEGPLTKEELLNIEELDLTGENIASLEGIQYLENLWLLELTDNQVADISPLKDLAALKNLHLRGNQIAVLDALGNLTNLEILYFADNEVKDIGVLKNLEKLEHLDLADNQVKDIAVLNKMTNLKKVWLGGNKVTDISSFENLVNLQWLIFPENEVSDISVLEELTNLNRLVFKDNQVDDLSALVRNEGLGSDDLVDMRNNQLILNLDSQHMQDIEALKNSGVAVQYIPQPLYGLSGLVTDEAGQGIAGAEISFSGDFSPVTTDSDGTWIKKNLSGEVTVTPGGNGYEFDPPYVEVSGPRRDVEFTKIVVNNTLEGILDIEHNWPFSVLEASEPFQAERFNGMTTTEKSESLMEEEKKAERDESRAAEREQEDPSEQFIVGFHPAASKAEKAKVFNNLEARVLGESEFMNSYLMEVPSSKKDTRMHLTLRNPAIEYIEPNYSAQAHSAVPDDPLYDNQWHYPQIRLPQAWSVTTGAPAVRIAVLDTGIDVGHPDLGTFVDVDSGFNFVDNNRNTHDVVGHGTHVAGIIGADTDNGLGVAGTMWKTEIIPVKVLSDNGSGSYWDIAQGIKYAAGLLEEPAISEPVQIINLSLGGTSKSTMLKSTVQAARDAGVLIVASSGNNGSGNISYPARYSETIAVGAVDYNDSNQPKRAAYSNYGSELDLVAPGGYKYGILSTTATSSNDEYIFITGTSAAAPHVSGIIGLMLAAGIDEARVRAILHRTSMDLGEEGFDPYYGHGLINAYWAVNYNEEINIVVGERQDNTIAAVAESQVGLRDRSFTLKDIPAGEHRVYGWIDVRESGTIDPGDYFAESEVIVFEAEGEYQVELILREHGLAEFTGEESKEVSYDIELVQ